MNDREILDWLQEQNVDVIYLDDGVVIDVRGESVRKSIEAAANRHRAAASGMAAKEFERENGNG